MPYPPASAADIEFFGTHGYLVVRNAADPADLDTLESHCGKILEQKERFAFDWAWEEGTSREERAFRLVQDPLLVHGSAPNGSSADRRALLYSYQPAGYRHAREYIRIDPERGIEISPSGNGAEL